MTDYKGKPIGRWRKEDLYNDVVELQRRLSNKNIIIAIMYKHLARNNELLIDAEIDYKQAFGIETS